MSLKKTKKDRQARIEDLKDQIEDITSRHSEGKIITIESGDYSEEIEEKFLEYVLAFEKGDHSPLFDHLTKQGLDLPSPDDLDDTQITKKLWEVIQSLSLFGTFLHNTDHMSDRELYDELWHDALREESFIQPGNRDSAYHLDMVGSGSEEDTFNYLKYYADEEERQSWYSDYPQDKMPAHEKKPYNRDCLLPQRENWGEA